MQDQDDSSGSAGETSIRNDSNAGQGTDQTSFGQPLTIDPALKSDWPTTDYPKPAVLTETDALNWNEDAAQAVNYIALGRRLAGSGDIYRNPQHGGGLLLASSCPAIPPTPIMKGTHLAPIIVDRLVVAVNKKGKPAGTQIPTKQLNVMLASEIFLQQFPPLDMVVATPAYLRDFKLTKPGYNNGGMGQRIYYAGKSPMISHSLDAINRFLDVMAFATDADRTNAVAAALTVSCRNLWPGAKPIILATATKSHAGKDTIIAFATGSAGAVSISYQAANWAFERALVGAVKTNPSAGVIVVENARMERRDQHIASAFIERFATDPAPVLFSTGTGAPLRVTNNYLLAISTNEGRVSTDILNRALPIHLEPVGDVAGRESPIGDPKREYLPANRDRIEAELRGLIERWKDKGKPFDQVVKHPFTEWARTIGGILHVAGFQKFLENYMCRKTEDDPGRQALGLLGAARPNTWLRPEELVRLAAELGLTKRLIPEADRDSPASQKRGLGVTLWRHRDEIFHAGTEDEIVVTKLLKARRRFDGGEPQTRYMFEVLKREPLPADGESVSVRTTPSGLQTSQCWSTTSDAIATPVGT